MKISTKFTTSALITFIFPVMLTGCGTKTDPQNREFNLNIENRQLNPDLGTIKVNHGDTLTFNISSDVSGTFHLHGYNKMTDLEAGVESKMTLVTDATGTFLIKLHLFDEEQHHHNEDHQSKEDNHSTEDWEITITRLEVHPR